MKADEAVQLVEASILFDANWYVERYPDVKAAKMSPAAHYCKYGWQMLRDPSSQFSTVEYLSSYKDIKNINPLVHYLKYGKKEQRSITPSQGKLLLKKIEARQLQPRDSNVNPQATDSKVAKQLSETQALLEYYYLRCKELEYQKIDDKHQVGMDAL